MAIDRLASISMKMVADTIREGIGAMVIGGETEIGMANVIMIERAVRGIEMGKVAIDAIEKVVEIEDRGMVNTVIGMTDPEKRNRLYTILNNSSIVNVPKTN